MDKMIDNQLYNLYIYQQKWLKKYTKKNNLDFTETLSVLIRTKIITGFICSTPARYINTEDCIKKYYTNKTCSIQWEDNLVYIKILELFLYILCSNYININYQLPNLTLTKSQIIKTTNPFPIIHDKLIVYRAITYIDNIEYNNLTIGSSMISPCIVSTSYNKVFPLHWLKLVSNEEISPSCCILKIHLTKDYPIYPLKVSNKEIYKELITKLKYKIYESINILTFMDTCIDIKDLLHFELPIESCIINLIYNKIEFNNPISSNLDFPLCCRFKYKHYYIIGEITYNLKLIPYKIYDKLNNLFISQIPKNKIYQIPIVIYPNKDWFNQKGNIVYMNSNQYEITLPPSEFLIKNKVTRLIDDIIDKEDIVDFFNLYKTSPDNLSYLLNKKNKINIIEVDSYLLDFMLYKEKSVYTLKRISK